MTSSLVDKIKKRLFECPICFGPLDEPRMLPCQHTGCKKCLRQYIQKHGKYGWCPCSVCKKEFRYDTSKGGSGFPKHDTLYILKEILEEEGEWNKMAVDKTEHRTAQHDMSSSTTYAESYGGQKSSTASALYPSQSSIDQKTRHGDTKRPQPPHPTVTPTKAVYSSGASQHISLYHNNSTGTHHAKKTIPALEDRLRDTIPPGLHNMGNTCYMNCVIQCLAHTKPLRDYCMYDTYKAEINTTSRMRGKLIEAYADLMKQLWFSDHDDVHKTSVRPDELKHQISKSAPIFSNNNQHDAFEFLVTMVMGLHEDLNRVQHTNRTLGKSNLCAQKASGSHNTSDTWYNFLKNDQSVITDLFVGQLKSSLTCSGCLHQVDIFEPFWQLSLPIREEWYTISLESCLTLFTQKKTLMGKDAPFCRYCNIRQHCTMEYQFDKFPQILVIQLNRFKTGVYSSISKLSTPVACPERIQLGNYAAGRVSHPAYKLYASVSHSGSQASGHYTANIKHPYSGKWHYFNDTRVVSDPVPYRSASDVYILFYERQ